MINTSNWKEFNLIDFFDMKAGKYYYSDEYNAGDTPYVSSSDTNNGIQQFIDIEPLFPGNCLTIGKVGCTTYYQPDPFCATCDVTVLIPRFKMNANIGLFIATLLNLEKNKWSYGRQIRLGDCKELVVNFPVKNDNTPDWEYMDEYIENIQSRERESTGSLKNSIKTDNKIIKKLSNVKEWKLFTLSDIFDIKYGINMELLNCDETNGNINFVARTAENNGVTAKVKIVSSKTPQEAGLISVAGGGSVLSTFLQEKEFYSGRDLYVLKTKKDVDRYAKLFLVTLIRKEKFKYSYGRQANKTLPYIEIKLPVDSHGNPDYNYMSSFMKTLPYADRI